MPVAPRRVRQLTVLVVAVAGATLAAPYVARCAAASQKARAGANARPAAATAAVVAGPPGAPPAALAAKLQLTPIVRKLDQPVDLDAAPGDTTGRLFVVEKPGRIRILRAGALVDTPFLDLTRRTSRGNEQGLLGLAFHPGYAKNGRFFVDYTDANGDSHVTEFHVDAKNPDRADPASEKDWFTVDQPYSNHNGGHVLFGPDGFLWIGFGDGGAANDPRGNGQKDGVRLGKMLRLDVDRPGAKPVAHWKGLRNPWRYAFDRKTGDLYIGDVGQDLFEEIDVVAAADTKRAGLNFGWNRMEGLHCFGADSCDAKGLVLPVVEYAHADGSGCSVTGGIVYRGKALPELDGAYFYADYCTALLRSFRWQPGQVADHWDWKPALDPKNKLATLAAFGEDAAGELYLVSHDGVIYRLERKP
jgi:glucose/arabinose dehydrogenase